MAELEVGQDVLVFHGTDSRRRTGKSSPGTVTKVGRKLVTIEYGEPGDRWRPTAQFRIETGHANDDYARTYFLTLEQADEEERRRAAIAVLEEHQIQLGQYGDSRRLTTEQVEELAAVVSKWGK